MTAGSIPEINRIHMFPSITYTAEHTITIQRGRGMLAPQGGGDARITNSFWPNWAPRCFNEAASYPAKRAIRTVGQQGISGGHCVYNEGHLDAILKHLKTIHADLILDASKAKTPMGTRPGEFLNATWKQLGGDLGPSWAALGPPLGPCLGSSWGIWEPS